MIRKITIQNFQSHKDTKIELNAGVNVIVGLSDTGKSAIIRALRWLVFNRPLGDAFRSSWGGHTYIEIITKKDRVIRTKTKSANNYTLYSDRKVDAFKALGSEIPDEIQQALNLTELNFQGQVDPHFLLGMGWSPGQVASHLNDITGLNKIDIALKSMNSDLTKINRDLKSNKERLVDLDEQKESFAFIKELEPQIIVLEGMERQARGLDSKASELESLIGALEIAEKAVTEHLWASEALELYDHIECRWDDIKLQKLLKDDLSQRIDRLEKLENEIEEHSWIEDANGQVEKLEELLGDDWTRSHRIKDLKLLIRRIENLNWNIKESGIKEAELEQEFHDLMPDICPLCGRGNN